MPITQLVRLTPSIPAHWAWMGDVTARIPAFMTRFHLDADPVAITRHLTSFWAAGLDSVAVWVALDEATVCGHAISVLEMSWNVPYGMVMQSEIDTPYVLSRDQQQEMLRQMTGWATAQGATCLKMLTPRNPDAWIRAMGFRFDKTLLMYPIEATPCSDS